LRRGIKGGGWFREEMWRRGVGKGVYGGHCV